MTRCLTPWRGHLGGDTLAAATRRPPNCEVSNYEVSDTFHGGNLARGPPAGLDTEDQGFGRRHFTRVRSGFPFSTT